MLTDKMQKALNEQVNAELYSAYLYLDISAFFESVNLKGFAHWMRIQYQEETLHAMKFFDYIHDRDGEVVLDKIDKPKEKVDSSLAAFELTLAHERKVSGLINDLVALAVEEKDFATQNYLQWFVSEQIEEEATANDILQQVKMVGDNPAGLFMLDRDMAGRPAPAAAAGEAGAAE
jgi:ferritin